MNVVFTPTAWQQYTDWQKEDKKIVKRINDLIRSIGKAGSLIGVSLLDHLIIGEKNYTSLREIQAVTFE